MSTEASRPVPLEEYTACVEWPTEEPPEGFNEVVVGIWFGTHWEIMQAMRIDRDVTPNRWMLSETISSNVRSLSHWGKWPWQPLPPPPKKHHMFCYKPLEKA